MQPISPKAIGTQVKGAGTVYSEVLAPWGVTEPGEGWGKMGGQHHWVKARGFKTSGPAASSTVPAFAPFGFDFNVCILSWER